MPDICNICSTRKYYKSSQNLDLAGRPIDDNGRLLDPESELLCGCTNSIKSQPIKFNGENSSNFPDPKKVGGMSCVGYTIDKFGNITDLRREIIGQLRVEKQVFRNKYYD